MAGRKRGGGRPARSMVSATACASSNVLLTVELSELLRRGPSFQPGPAHAEGLLAEREGEKGSAVSLSRACAEISRWSSRVG